MKRRAKLSEDDLNGVAVSGFIGPMRPGKTLRDKRSGAWARRLANRRERADAQSGKRR